MRIKDYENACNTASKLRNIVTNPVNCAEKIHGILEDKYKLIVKMEHHELKDVNMAVYSIGKVEDVFCILVVCDGINRVDLSAICGSGGTPAIINNASSAYMPNIDRSDVYIICATGDIFESIPDLYKTYYDRTLHHPADDIYYMYIFFMTFKGLYTEDDFNTIIRENLLDDRAAMAVERLVEHYVMIDVYDIAEALEWADSKITKSETK